MSEPPNGEDQPLLADPAPLARKVGREPDDQAVLDAIRDASGMFRDEVRHYVHRVQEEAIYLDSAGVRALRLPVCNVETVHEVTVGGVEVPVMWSKDGILERLDGRTWPRGYGVVIATVTHGLDPIPGGIQAAVRGRAETIYRVRRGLSSYQVGGISMSQGAQEAVGATAEWETAVERWRIRAGDRS